MDPLCRGKIKLSCLEVPYSRAEGRRHGSEQWGEGGFHVGLKYGNLLSHLVEEANHLCNTTHLMTPQLEYTKAT